MKNMTTIVLADAFLDDIFKSPEEYVDETFDLALLQLVPENESPVMVMMGKDEEEGLYIVLEDEEVSQYFFKKNADDCMYAVYKNALKEWGLLGGNKNEK